MLEPPLRNYVGLLASGATHALDVLVFQFLLELRVQCGVALIDPLLTLCRLAAHDARLRVGPRCH